MKKGDDAPQRAISEEVVIIFIEHYLYIVYHAKPFEAVEPFETFYCVLFAHRIPCNPGMVKYPSANTSVSFPTFRAKASIFSAAKGCQSPIEENNLNLTTIPKGMRYQSQSDII